MKIVLKMVPVVAAVLLTGCVGPSSSLGIRTEAQLAAARIQPIAIVDEVPDGAEVIGDETGVSCKNKLWSPDATEAAALDQLRAKAVEAGAAGIASVSFKTEGTTIAANCWSAIYAEGTLYK